MEVRAIGLLRRSEHPRSASILSAAKGMASLLRATVGSARAIRLVAEVRPLVLGIVVITITWTALIYHLDSGGNTSPGAAEDASGWASAFNLDMANLSSTGKAPYFNLEPGHRLRYQDGDTTRTVTVLRKTKLIDGVETRVIEKREEIGGQLSKASRKYYAIDRATKAVYCFGVHVDSYEDGKAVSHRGWRSGVNGATFSLVMPGVPKVGDKLVRQHAKRLYEVTDIVEKVVTPAGTFNKCLRMQSAAAAENEADEKVYAPGIGLVKDGRFALVKIAKTVPKKQLGSSADCSTIADRLCG
jgi:hypothetical protein